MNNIKLKKNQLQLYKRKNSKIWQIKIKLPFKKALRITSGTTIIDDAKEIAFKKYNFLSLDNLKEISIKKNYPLKKIHLINSKDLNK